MSKIRPKIRLCDIVFLAKESELETVYYCVSQFVIATSSESPVTSVILSLFVKTAKHSELVHMFLVTVKLEVPRLSKVFLCLQHNEL